MRVKFFLWLFASMFLTVNGAAQTRISPLNFKESKSPNCLPLMKQISNPSAMLSKMQSLPTRFWVPVLDEAQSGNSHQT